MAYLDNEILSIFQFYAVKFEVFSKSLLSLSTFIVSCHYDNLYIKDLEKETSVLNLSVPNEFSCQLLSKKMHLILLNCLQEACPGRVMLGNWLA